LIAQQSVHCRQHLRRQHLRQLFFGEAMVRLRMDCMIVSIYEFQWAALKRSMAIIRNLAMREGFGED